MTPALAEVASYIRVRTESLEHSRGEGNAMRSLMKADALLAIHHM